MIYSKEKQFLFIHIPKTGGKSMSSVLAEYASHNTNFDHLLVRKLTLKFGSFPRLKIYSRHEKLSQFESFTCKSEYSKLWKFSIVRNPYDRLVSLFLFQQQYSEANNHKLIKNMTFDDFVNWMNPWMKKTSMVSFIKNNDGKIDMDFIGRFENLNEDVNKIFEHLNIDKRLPYINKTKKTDSYRNYYNDKLIKLVQKNYEEDLDFFKYVF